MYEALLEATTETAQANPDVAAAEMAQTKSGIPEDFIYGTLGHTQHDSGHEDWFSRSSKSTGQVPQHILEAYNARPKAANIDSIHLKRH